jgi:hypothetical protein
MFMFGWGLMDCMARGACHTVVSGVMLGARAHGCRSQLSIPDPVSPSLTLGLDSLALKSPAVKTETARCVRATVRMNVALNVRLTMNRCL